MIVTDLNILRRPCKEASLFEADAIIKKLEDELNISSIKGVGLSANQIGIDARVCIIRAKTISINLVNPVIVASYDLGSFANDGCLSIPGIFITTQRFNEVFVKDLLHPAGIIVTGLDAVIVQHEIDHLNGIVMFDRQIQIPFRNDKCWCGSDKKYKVCHYGRIIR